MILLLPYVENHVRVARAGVDGFDRDLGGAAVREAEHAGRDAAERDAAQTVFPCESETASIARRKLFFVPFGQRTENDRSDRVQHVPCGQIVARRELRRAGLFAVSLLLHDLMASEPQLNARKGVDRVVDAAVIRRKTAQQLRICGVDDRIDLERRDVSAPKIPVRAHRRKIEKRRHALFPRRFLQVCVLQRQKRIACGHRRAHVQKSPQKPLLPVGVLRDRHALILLFFEQRPNQPDSTFVLCHDSILSCLLSHCKEKTKHSQFHFPMR